MYMHIWPQPNWGITTLCLSDIILAILVPGALHSSEPDFIAVAYFLIIGRL